MFFDNYNTLKLLDENICDAKLIQLVVISTFFYIRNDTGDEFLLMKNEIVIAAKCKYVSVMQFKN